MTPLTGYSKSYLIPIGDLSLADRGVIRASADQAAVQQAYARRIKDNVRDLLVRDGLPTVDTGLTTNTSSDDWLMAGPGVQGTELQYFSQVIAQNSIFVFWGASTPMAVPSITWIRFGVGSTSGTTRGKFMLRQLYDSLEPRGYFSQAIVYNNNDVCRVTVMPRLAFVANSEYLDLMLRVCEPLTIQVSVPTV